MIKSMKKHCFLLIISIFSSFLFAQSNNFIGKEIAEISVRYKEQGAEYPKSRWTSFIDLKVGDILSYDNLNSATKDLYDSGLIDDVSTLVDSAPDGKVKVIFELSTRVLLNKVGFKGNDKFSDRTLITELNLNIGDVLTDKALFQAKKTILASYSKAGFPNAQVSYDLKTLKSGYANLVFTINEENKQVIEEIVFHGNDFFAQQDLLRYTRTKPKGVFSFLTKSGRFEKETWQRDLKNIIQGYQDKGYLKASIKDWKLSQIKDDKWQLVTTIDEGLLYEVTKVTVESTSIYKASELQPQLFMQGGQSYSASKVSADRQTIANFYGSKGYADVRISPNLTNQGKGKVSLTYQINPGKSYITGQIEVEGNIKTKDEVIRRELIAKPGKPLSSVDLDVSESRLRNLNYFNAVSVSTKNSNQISNARDVEIKVEEKATGSVSFGAGISSIDSVVGFIDLTQTNFDVTNLSNFSGAGQRFNANARLGSERSEFSISLTEPWFRGRPLAVGVEFFSQDSSFFSDIYDQENLGISVFARKRLGKKSNIRLQYRVEQIELDYDFNEVSSIPNLFSNEDDYIKSAIELRYSFEEKDSLFTTREGRELDLSLNLAGGPFAGDIETVTFEGSYTQFWNFKWDTILIWRSQFAFVDNWLGGDEIPVFERQFLGGANDLRGFDFREAGTFQDVNPNGNNQLEVIGGNSKLATTLEYTIPLGEVLRGAIFSDIGSIDEDTWSLSSEQIYGDVGLGIRIQTPQFPLALDYAIPVIEDDERADDGAQFNFYLNYSF